MPVGHTTHAVLAAFTAIVTVVALPVIARAQATMATVIVRVEHEGEPLPGALVRGPGASVRTGDDGSATLSLPAGEHRLSVALLGFAPESLLVTVRAGAEHRVLVELREQAARLAPTIVTTTRAERRIEDEPLRVEIIGEEEVSEKVSMRPADISMLLNETGGVRVQSTAPSIGGASVRIHGLRGRYTQILGDGLPLHGATPGGLGVLQIPPLDLAGVEVVKGVASALYGGAALGGVVNLLARRPDGGRELLVNQTSRDGSDLALWTSDELSEAWSYTLLAGAHRQRRTDIDGDGWTDMPGYERAVVRPRVYWRDESGRSLWMTVGTTLESRRGGTMDGANAPDGAPFAESLRTRRADAGAVGRMARGADVLALRMSASATWHRHEIGMATERDRHATMFAEASWARTFAWGTSVIGMAAQHDTYRSADLPVFDFDFVTGATFAEASVTPVPWLSASASTRLDAHDEYGVIISPRLSALVRLADGWTARLSAGTGFFAATPLIEEVEPVGLAAVGRSEINRAERAAGGSFDLGGRLGPVEINGTLFGSRIEHAVVVQSGTESPSAAAVHLEQPRRQIIGAPDGELVLTHAREPVWSWGSDVFARFRKEPVVVTASYTYLRVSEHDPVAAVRREAPLTARHTAGLVTMIEDHQAGSLLGVELYYTGAQRLADNPYRSRGAPHVIIGALVQRRFGRATVFLNGENLLDVRLTDYHSLVRPAAGEGGRWTTDEWAPLDGRVFNLGVRLALIRAADDDHH
ncbi:MAG TPA: TonB-dependent receptor [Gemmatimonadaceae bacterium]|nr:TonB-dependent receptor [Gemmatimonadaceae bacterium]